MPVLNSVHTPDSDVNASHAMSMCVPRAHRPWFGETPASANANQAAAR